MGAADRYTLLEPHAAQEEFDYMPFGAFFAALFYTVLGLWALFAAAGSSGTLGPARWAVALLCLSLVIGLLLRRGWARWSAALLACGLVALDLLLAVWGAGFAAYAILFGSLATAAFLLVPATGDLRRGLDGPAPRSRLASLAAATAALGAIGLVGGLGWAVADRPDEGVRLAVARPPGGLPGRVQWADYARGTEQARGEDKPMLVTFVTNWCGYCRKMDRTTWKDPQVVEWMQKVVPVRVDAEEGALDQAASGRELASRFDVSGFPTLILLDSEGRMLSRTGGYMTPGQLLGWLDGAMRDGRSGNIRVSAP
jgi:thiol:disulfide interchange protein